MDTLSRGGAERQISLIIDHVREFGYEVAMIVLYQDGFWGDYLRAKGIPVMMMGFRAPPTLNRRILVPFLRLILAMRSSKPDIVIASLYRASIWSSLAAKLSRTPVVISRRADNGIVAALHPFPRFVERIGMRWIKRFVAVSNTIVDFTRSEGVPSHRITLIHNGVELSDRAPSEFDRYHDARHTMVIGNLSNLSKVKDHLTLVRAMGRVVGHHPLVTCWIGGTDAGTWQDVKAEIKRLALEKVVIYKGAVEDSQAFIRSIDIGVLCSFSEGFSNTLLEYMALSKPVVATDIDGNREIVIDGQTGLLVPAADPEKLANALLTLVASPERMEQYGRDGRKRVEEHFSIKHIARQWNALFETLMNKEGNS